MGSQRVGHDWATEHTHTHAHTQESILEIILAQLSGHSCSSSRLTTLGLRTSSNTVRSLLHRQRLPLPLQVSKAHVKTSAIQGCQPRACLGHHLSIPSRQGNKVPDTLWDHTVQHDAVLMAWHSLTPISGFHQACYSQPQQFISRMPIVALLGFSNMWLSLVWAVRSHKARFTFVPKRRVESVNDLSHSSKPKERERRRKRNTTQRKHQYQRNCWRKRDILSSYTFLSRKRKV